MDTIESIKLLLFYTHQQWMKINIVQSQEKVLPQKEHLRIIYNLHERISFKEHGSTPPRHYSVNASTKSSLNIAFQSTQVPFWFTLACCMCVRLCRRVFARSSLPPPRRLPFIKLWGQRRPDRIALHDGLRTVTPDVTELVALVASCVFAVSTVARVDFHAVARKVVLASASANKMDTIV